MGAFSSCVNYINSKWGLSIFNWGRTIAYIHFRNVIGNAPNYQEVFIDEGQVDMKRIIQILKKENYDGVLIPDHAPEMTCDAPWHAGMAYAMGYIKSLLMN